MILRGLLDTSLGGFVCIRGYARLGELSRASHADLDYQRELIKTHREEVTRFLRNRKNLFFPEVILSCVLTYDFTRSGAKSGVAPLGDIMAGNGFRSNVDGISVGLRTLSYKGKIDARASELMRVATFDVPDTLLSKGTTPPFFRIDGNHRLSAADENNEFKDIVTPFCIMLFGAGEEGERNSKTIFHNINSKSIPLTSEEILKIILDDKVLFPDESLKEPTSFGWAYLLARKARPAIVAASLPALSYVMAQPRTVLVELFKLLLTRKAISASARDLDKVVKCLSDVQEIYATEVELKTNQCVGLFHAYAYFCLTDGKNRSLKPFQHWIKGNHLTALTSIDAPALIEIFERVHTARERTIFVSMQFGTTSQAIYDTIEKAVDQINKDTRPKIKIRPLRIDKLNKGHSYTITDEILAAIESSGLLIADLTYRNPNVYHEVGYLMGLNRGRYLKQENFILIARDRPEDKLEQKMGFNLRGVSQIRFKETIDLEVGLIKAIRTYYSLGDE